MDEIRKLEELKTWVVDHFERYANSQSRPGIVLSTESPFIQQLIAAPGFYIMASTDPDALKKKDDDSYKQCPACTIYNPSSQVSTVFGTGSRLSKKKLIRLLQNEVGDIETIDGQLRFLVNSFAHKALSMFDDLDDIAYQYIYDDKAAVKFFSFSFLYPTLDPKIYTGNEQEYSIVNIRFAY